MDLRLAFGQLMNKVYYNVKSHCLDTWLETVQSWDSFAKDLILNWGFTNNYSQ